MTEYRKGLIYQSHIDDMRSRLSPVYLSENTNIQSGPGHHAEVASLNYLHADHHIINYTNRRFKVMVTADNRLIIVNKSKRTLKLKCGDLIAYSLQHDHPITVRNITGICKLTQIKHQNTLYFNISSTVPGDSNYLYNMGVYAYGIVDNRGNVMSTVVNDMGLVDHMLGIMDIILYVDHRLYMDSPMDTLHNSTFDDFYHFHLGLLTSKEDMAAFSDMQKDDNNTCYLL